MFFSHLLFVDFPLEVLDCLEYDIKLSYGKAPALEIWGMWCTLSLPLFPDSLCSGVVAPDKVLSMSQIEQTMCKQMTDVKLWLLYSNTWNHLTVCKKELRLI